MEKPNRPPDEPLRLAALKRLNILDTPPEDRFDRLGRLAVSLLGVPTALISLTDAERQWFKARLGFDLKEVPRDVSFCGHAILAAEPFIVLDAAKDPRFADNPLVVSGPNIRFYAGVPLRLSTGETIGTLCIMDRIPRVIDDRRIQILRDLAALAVDEFEGATVESALGVVRAQDAKHRALLDETTDMIVSVDPEGLVLQANAALRSTLGYGAEDPRGMKALDLIAPDSRDSFAATLSRALKGEECGVMDAVLLSKSGERILARVRAFPHLEERPAHARLVFRDVTAQTRSSERSSARLAASKARRRRVDKELSDLKAAVESSALVAETDAAGLIIGVNDRAAELSGYAREELLGKTHKVLGSGAHPDAFFKELWETIASGRTWRGEICNRARNGAAYWVDTTITPSLGADGKPFRYIAISHDISGRKLAETRAAESGSRLQAVLDTATQIGIIVTDLEGRITLFNKGAENLLGFAAAETLGKPPALFSPDAAAFAVLAGSPPREAAFVRKDQTALPVKLTVTALHGPKGEVTGHLGVAIDVTSSQLAREELAKARDAVLDLAKAKALFLESMSREIRAPMNAVAAASGLLLDTSMAPQQREFAEAIRGAGESLLTMIGDILDYSTLEAGGGAFEEYDFDPRAVAEDVAMLFAARARSKGLGIAVAADDDLPARARGDAGRLRQILAAYADNALKFTAAGEIIIGVRRVTEAGAAVRLRYEVKDTGAGLDQAAQARLFSAFAGGTGLGLALAKKLVDSMKGAVGAVSAPGKGSTFWFEAGLSKAAAAPPAEPPIPASARVLIVDANETARRITAQLTASWRLRPLAVVDGASALAALRAAEAEGDPFMLALVDRTLPDMDGAQLAAEIKGDATLVAVRMILVSSPPAMAAGDELSRQGFDGALAKPMRKSSLQSAISGVLSGPAARVEPPASWKGRRILVVEDNPGNRRLAVFQLQTLGCTADAVANGREALATLGSIPYDLVLMDCLMPEMDGFAATAAIRALPALEGRKTAILGLTAGALEAYRKRGLAAGMDDVLPKPALLEDLAAALGRWCGENPAESPQAL